MRYFCGTMACPNFSSRLARSISIGSSELVADLVTWSTMASKARRMPCSNSVIVTNFSRDDGPIQAYAVQFSLHEGLGTAIEVGNVLKLVKLSSMFSV